MYKGVRFRRTPEQLGLPPEDWTAKRSQSAWLQWLRAAIKDFDLTGKRPTRPKKERKQKHPTLAQPSGGVPKPSYPGWEGPPRYRWSKMLDGKRIRVTCAQLGLPKECWNAKDSHDEMLKWFTAMKDFYDVNSPLDD